ncbi:hypothetical protein TIFTF001_035222 [Ficus carica]|uniref:Uncharacterized protein n=1 Tax=Ficus carica TaxID=3494 RepID=A0AA88E1A3_FICCA|nr:hypothetical protein TIFTF001_035222 [Ficus carica]
MTVTPELELEASSENAAVPLLRLGKSSFQGLVTWVNHLSPHTFCGACVELGQ